MIAVVINPLYKKYLYKGEIIMAIEKKNIFFTILIGSIIVALFTYGIFIRMHYSVDTYSVFFEDNANIQLLNSRYLNFVIGSLLINLGINPVIYQCLFTVILILSLSWCMVRTTYCVDAIINFNNDSILRVIIWLIVSVAFINVFVLEWFLYPEITLYYSIAILFAVEAAMIIRKNQTLKNYILAFCFLMIALFSYQAVMPVFIIVYLTYVVIDHDIQYKMKAIFGGILVGALGSIFLIIIQKVFYIGGSRTANLSLKSIIENIHELLVFQKDLWINQMGFFLEYSLILVIILIAVLFCYYKRLTLKNIVKIVMILAINYCIIFMPHLVSSNLWLAQRTLVAFWAFISSIGIIAIWVLRDDRGKYALGLMYAFIVLLNIGFIWEIGNNHFYSNAKDYQYICKIEETIDQYERESGIEVKKISTCQDKNFRYSYSDVKYVYCDTNVKCFSVPWGDVTAINYYTESNYMKVDMDDEIFNRNFKDKDWDMFYPSEQMVFDNDTLYICFY